VEIRVFSVARNLLRSPTRVVSRATRNAQPATVTPHHSAFL